MIVDQLRRDVLVGTKHRQARAGGRALHTAPDPGVPAAAKRHLVMGAGHYLAAFPALRTTRSPGSGSPCPCRARACELADVCGYLADLFLVDSLDDDPGGEGT